ncbi:helix-hairpin-helix domain-containing protein [Sunxiuqinia elliptica]|uniref:DNA uptake protein ComE-like DNA-binding protein n=1 Tax=Sunxiuqinia elliptica TaxID=655355 RepID=A0A4R6H6B9_9BACT|nr:helix-hairpin-helix domain-containing protein [Sunxiuqinia elliptica]TDO03091.1 DNA uptake protein ComE-like DNA-binding protein [Sunxiuqinia elliptica]TDO59290.1 DNA uptake protein ComE-like DNA-binding protein [Sunxiuqinia elliptica]
MRFRNIIREYFTFTRNERLGIIVLLVLIGLGIAANQLVFYFEKPAKIDPDELDELMLVLDRQREDAKRTKGVLFPFDPNMIDSLALDSLKLPLGIKRNLLKYRDKGGRFYKATDFGKLYGVTDSIYAQLEPYIVVEKAFSKTIALEEDVVLDKPKKQYQAPVHHKKERPELIELNLATPEELVLLYGIGEVLSKRIVKYRDLLGGFVGLEQLSEVYGLKPETIKKILPYLELDTSLVTQINVNFAETKELARHPYITWELARALVDFRSSNGFIHDLQLVRSNGLINDRDFQRISPYLKTKE